MAKMKHEIICIAGRTAAGKSAIAKGVAEKLGLNVVKSYKTGVPRPEEIAKGLENADHIFISNEEYNLIPEEDKAAETFINGAHYCTTYNQLDKSDIYVIDPKGIEDLKKTGKYHIVEFYIYAAADIRKKRFTLRGQTSSEFEKRSQAEEEQFSNYEKTHGYDIIFFNNDKLEDTVDNVASYVKIILKRRIEGGLSCYDEINNREKNENVVEKVEAEETVDNSAESNEVEEFKVFEPASVVYQIDLESDDTSEGNSEESEADTNDEPDEEFGKNSIEDTPDKESEADGTEIEDSNDGSYDEPDDTENIVDDEIDESDEDSSEENNSSLDSLLDEDEEIEDFDFWDEDDDVERSDETHQQSLASILDNFEEDDDVFDIFDDEINESDEDNSEENESSLDSLLDENEEIESVDFGDEADEPDESSSEENNSSLDYLIDELDEPKEVSNEIEKGSPASPCKESEVCLFKQMSILDFIS